MSSHNSYGLVIPRSPSYQKGSFVADRRITRPPDARRLPDLLAPGGHALLCLNSPEAGRRLLQEQMQTIAPELEFVQRIANPPVFADVSSERAPEGAGLLAPA